MYITKRVLPSKHLNFLLALTITLLLIIVFFSNYIPSIFYWGSDFEKLIYTISLSFITSYIFYYVVVYRKELKDKENISTYIYTVLFRITSRNNILIDNIFNNIFDPPDIKVAGNISYNEMKVILSKVDTNSVITDLKFESIGEGITWLEYLKFYSLNVQKDINKLLNLLPYLDSELAKLLIELDDSALFRLIDQLVVSDTLTSNSFSNLEPTTRFFHYHYENCKTLSDYREYNYIFK
ncbi:hypothetical protein [Pseudoalteromonas sp. 31A1]|uniref:hypothetical protein n=1 Tax=Pseudoalteromonas sp. 31A1 TaxID=2686351 RepID=UPI0013FE0349|nr:hypothetical protein [Pseudoalteromonas sp. 31A1]